MPSPRMSLLYQLTMVRLTQITISGNAGAKVTRTLEDLQRWSNQEKGNRELWRQKARDGTLICRPDMHSLSNPDIWLWCSYQVLFSRSCSKHPDL